MEKEHKTRTGEELSALLRKNSLFAPMTDAEIAEALSLFDARPATYARGEILHPMEEVLPAFGFVMAGTVQVYTDDLDGNRMMMANVGEGGTFGESLAYLCTPAPVYIQTASGAEVLWLYTARLKAGTPQTNALHTRFTAALAARTLEMNDRIQILSKTTLREKILCFLSQAERKAHARTFTVPFDREGLGPPRASRPREDWDQRCRQLWRFLQCRVW